MENYTVALIDTFFDKELKNYLSLEKIIFDAYEVYEQSKDDRIREILEKNINVAKNQLFILLEIMSNNADYKLKKSYEEKLNAKIEDLNDIDRRIKGISR